MRKQKIYQWIGGLLCVLMVNIMVASTSLGQSAEDYLNQGLNHYENGRLDEAIAAYERSIQLQPNNAFAHYCLGVVYHSKEMLDKASELYEKSIKLDQNLAEAYCGLGVIYHGKQILDKAASLYEDAIKRDVNLAFAHLQLGNVYLNLGKYHEAVQQYEKVLKIDSDDPNIVAEASKNLKEAKEKVSASPPPPPNVRVASKPEQMITSNIPEEVIANSLNLRKMESVPFSPDIYGRYFPRTRYITHFQPYKLHNVFLMWKTVIEYIKYKQDLSTCGMRDGWQFSEYTFKMRRGDCEDSSILLCDWLRSMGYDAKVVAGFAQDGGHAWVVVYEDGKACFLETAADTKVSRRHIPYFQNSLKKYAVQYMFDEQGYWEKR